MLRHSVKYPHTAERAPCGSYVRYKPGARSEPASGRIRAVPHSSARMLVPVAAAGDGLLKQIPLPRLRQRPGLPTPIGRSPPPLAKVTGGQFDQTWPRIGMTIRISRWRGIECRDRHLFADVSELMCRESLNIPTECCRSASATAPVGIVISHNYRWMRSAFGNGRLTFGIVCTCPSGWWANANTVRSMIGMGSLHPRVALMLDVESGGNPPGDRSSWISQQYWNETTPGTPVPESSVMPTPTTSSTWRVRPAGLCASWRGLWVPIRTFPDQSGTQYRRQWV